MLNSLPSILITEARKQITLVVITDSGTSWPEFKSQLCHLLAV